MPFKTGLLHNFLHFPPKLFKFAHLPNKVRSTMQNINSIHSDHSINSINSIPSNNSINSNNNINSIHSI